VEAILRGLICEYKKGPSIYFRERACSLKEERMKAGNLLRKSFLAALGAAVGAAVWGSPVSAQIPILSFMQSCVQQAL